LRGPRAPEVVTAAPEAKESRPIRCELRASGSERAYWLERFTLDEIRQLAAGPAS
jgi:hypothetical protein